MTARPWEQMSHDLGAALVMTKKREDVLVVLQALFALLDSSRVADPAFDREAFMRAFFRGVAAHAEDQLPAYN